MEFDLSLQNLLNLTLIWTLLHLLTTNQVQELGRQDEVTLDSLSSNKNRSESVIGSVSDLLQLDFKIQLAAE